MRITIVNTLSIPSGAASVLSSMFLENTIADIAEHQEETAERQKQIGGLFNMFYKLPIGVREIAIVFFSQIAPFPPYSVIVEASTIPQYIIGIIVIICEVFWYFISYQLIFFLLRKEGRKKFKQFDYLFLGSAVLLLLLLTAHPDVRRMMPVYPIIYLSYLKIKTTVPKDQLSQVRSGMMVCYVVLLFVYFTIKGV